MVNIFLNSNFLAAGDGKAPVVCGEEDDDEVPGQYVALNPPPPRISIFFNNHLTYLKS